MTIAYLDPDDEITSAVARLRASDDIRVALVLPPGSRIATSRINFRLLAHEAREHQRRLAIVAAEPGVRQIAVSAGIPAYGTVSDYETAVAEARTAAQEREAAGTLTGEVAVGGEAAVLSGDASTTTPAPAAGAPTREMPAVAAAVAADVALESGAGAIASDRSPTVAEAGVESGARRGGAQALPVVGARVTSGRGRRGVWALASLGLLAAIVLVVGAAVLLLPSATIVLTPATEGAGPVDLTVIADPNATQVDAANGIVPAQTVTVPLTATSQFQATGKKTSLTKAGGTVTFSSYDTGSATVVPAGKVVATADGVQFATQARVTLPPAALVGFPVTVVPSQRTVAVQAVTAGPEGNVAANAITKVPSGYSPTLLRVTNVQPTSGGSRTDIQVVSQKDYDDATKTLAASLKSQLDGAVADPATAPSGTTLIPATAALGQVTPSPLAAAVVNKEQPTFDLTLTATGTVNAVDKAQLEQVATERLKASVPAGYELFSDSIKTTVGTATVSGGKISAPVEASGEMARQLDQAALLAQVKGKSVDEARAILEPFGAVSIQTWPFYVSSIPTFDNRVTLTIAPPQRNGS
ncbi:MAG: baseplate J/gp47 family protein [Candidatus Limnocylindrales bacterium]